MDVSVIYVGTCGFSYPDWRGPFYPGTLSKAKMLPYYAGCFPAVEIDASYYGVPEPHQIGRMDAATPPHFRFCFKAPRSISHPAGIPDRVHADAQTFVRALDPVVRSGKLGCVLVQFPNGFKPSAAARQYVRRVAASLEPLALIFEFRHREWQQPETLEMLAQLEAGWCNVDMPEHEALLAPASDVTSQIGYVRFHGRNAAQWWSGDNVTRYAYDYSDAELASWTARIAEIDAAAQTTYAFFNNHARGNAARNAERFAELLEEAYGPAAASVVMPHRAPARQERLF